MSASISVCIHDHLGLWYVQILCSRGGPGTQAQALNGSRSPGLAILRGQIILLARRYRCSQEVEPEREMSLCQKLLQMEEPVCLGSPWLWEEPFGKVVGRKCLAARMLEAALGWRDSGLQQRWLVGQITIWWAECCPPCFADREEQVPVGETELSMTGSDRHNRLSPLHRRLYGEL